MENLNKPRRTASRDLCRTRIGEVRKSVASPDGAYSRWSAAGFLIANAMALHRAGPYRAPGRQAIAGTWPETTVDDALGRKHAATSLIPYLDEQTRLHGRAWRQRADDDFLAGLHEGDKWTRKHRRLVTADEAARRLWVGLEERDDLRLRTIGASDCSKAKRAEYAKDRRRERDRLRIEGKRRAKGSVPRAEYLANSTAAEARRLGVSVSTLRRQRKRAAQACDAGVSSHCIDPTGLLNIRQGDGPASPATKGQEALAQTVAPALHALRVEKTIRHSDAGQKPAQADDGATIALTSAKRRIDAVWGP